MFTYGLKLHIQRLRAQVYLRRSYWRATVDWNDRISGQGDIQYFTGDHPVTELMKNPGRGRLGNLP